MTPPGSPAHSIFVAGNDTVAKHTVEGLLSEFGWRAESIIDLGDITGARGVEMYARLFFTLYNAFGTFDFNINVKLAPTNRTRFATTHAT